jgi:hypothetical protein
MVHSISLCEELQTAFCDRLRPDTVPADFGLGSDERLHFVLSGDLTRVGSKNDFYLAYQWLLGSWTRRDLVNTPEHVGLRIPQADLHSVPGNHDQWDDISPGVTNFLFKPDAYNAHLTPTWFKPTPWHQPIPSPDGDFILDLFGVDSNSGLDGEIGNFFAEGSISNRQLQELEDLLIKSEADQKDDKKLRLRAIVCHHSFYGKFPTLCLRQASVDVLTSFAYRYDVAAILTGHMHSVVHDEYTSADGKSTFWEIRAATATQRGKQPGWPGFWVHQLTCDRGQLRWEAFQYETDANQGPFVQSAARYRIR